MVKTITKPPDYVWSVVRERDGVTVQLHCDPYAAAWCAWERERADGYRHVVKKTRLIPDFIRGEMVPKEEASCGAHHIRPTGAGDHGRLTDRGGLDGGPEAG